MRGVMLFAAGLFAGLLFQVGTAQDSTSGVVMMNHVGISVPNIDQAVAYYTQKMGYREAFRANDEKGSAKTHSSSSTPSPRNAPPVFRTMGSSWRTPRRRWRASEKPA
jgi:hypothetical protein